MSSTDEENDTRAHNAVNEIGTRNSGGISIVYDAAGNMTDDGVDYEYEWDAFYRLRKVKDQSSALVAEYRYNGLGHRIAEHADTDTDGDVDGSDVWFYDAFDERWRQVARFRDTDATPKEEFVAHQAGLGGDGGSSYIDLVALRQKDANTAWASATDGVREERIYYSQNWRADASTLVSSAGQMLEWVKYSTYGEPINLPRGDSNSDGTCDSSDEATIKYWLGGYDARNDPDLDGDIDADDVSILNVGATGGVSVLSQMTIRSSRGSIGAIALTNTLCAERHRLRTGSLGWVSRDYLGYVDGVSLYELLRSNALARQDPLGGCSMPVSGSGATGGTSGSGGGPQVSMSDGAGFGAGSPCKETGLGGVFWERPPSIFPEEYIPLGSRHMTAWDCRCALQQQDNDKTSLLPDGEKAGAVSGCWNGQPTYCLRSLGGHGLSSSDRAERVQIACLIAHEQDHVNNAAAKNRCAGAGDGWTGMSNTGPADVAAMEYSAIKVQNDCLKRAAQRDPTNKAEYDNARLSNEAYVNSVAAKTGTTPPPEVSASCH